MPSQKFKELATNQHKSAFNQLYDKYVKENKKIETLLGSGHGNSMSDLKPYTNYRKKEKSPPTTSSFTPKEGNLIKLHHELNVALHKECNSRYLDAGFRSGNALFAANYPKAIVPPEKMDTFKPLFQAIKNAEQALEKEELSTISKHGKFKNFEPEAYPKAKFTPEKEKEPEHSETTGMEMKEITNSFKEKLTEAKKNTPNTGRSADSSDEENSEKHDDESPRATL